MAEINENNNFWSSYKKRVPKTEWQKEIFLNPDDYKGNFIAISEDEKIIGKAVSRIELSKTVKPGTKYSVYYVRKNIGNIRILPGYNK